MKKAIAKAFSEVDTILSYMDSEDVNKIPENLRKMFKEKMDKDYKVNINTSVPLKNQNLKEETLGILAVLNLKYWCKDENEKKKILKIYAENEEKHQEELRKIYNPNDIFSNTHMAKKKDETQKEKNLVVVEKETPFFIKILNKVKTVFSKDNTNIKIDENSIIEITDENGNNKKILLIFYFTLKSNKKDYIIYKDIKQLDNNTVYASEVVQENNTIKFENIRNSKIVEEIKNIAYGLKVKTKL